MLHSAYAAQYNTTVLASLRNLNTTTNPEVQNDVSIGSPYPQFVAIVAQKPRVQFAADRVDSALAVTGVAGAPINATNNFTAFYAALGETGQPAAGSVHRSYVMNRGLLVPRRLTCEHQRPAMLDMEALTYSDDGANHPLVISDVAALPTLAAADVQHTLGPIVLGTTGSDFTHGCATSLTIDFGNRAATRGCSSDVFDKHIEQPGIQVVVSITGLDAAVFGTAGIPPVGKLIEHAATTIYLRKRNQGGVGFVADIVADHVKFTVDGVGVVTEHSGQGNAAATCTLQITCKFDGALAPITINTASAIT